MTSPSPGAQGAGLALAHHRSGMCQTPMWDYSITLRPQGAVPDHLEININDGVVYSSNFRQ